MRRVAEDVLRQRFCRWHECNAIFWICRSCDHGQQYCSDNCRAKARREQRRAANHRHRKTPEGKLDQRDRQRAYRQRLTSFSVMDQGSQDNLVSGSIIPPVFSPVAALNSGRQAYEPKRFHKPGMPCCIICGRPGRFVNPFHLRGDP
jgi:hypothetical protein